MAGQFGGGRIGGVALTAGGMTPQPFTALTRGPIGSLQLLVTFTLISTGSTFVLVVDTGSSAASEGTDDLDIIMNAIYTKLSLYADSQTLQGNEGMPRWRTWLGVANIRDFIGNLLNGSSVPASGGTAKTFQLIIQFPYSLRDYFADGDVWHQGSTRLRDGRFEHTIGSSLTPNVVLANGTATVGGLSIQVFPKACGGTENDVAPTWQLTSPTGVQTVYDLDSTQRCFLAFQQTAGTVGLTLPIDVGPYDRTPAGQFQAYYQAENLVYSGFDATQRCLPLLFIGRTRTFQDFLANLGEVVHIDAASTNLSTLSLIDVKVLPVSPSGAQNVAQVVGAGGPISAATIGPPSGQAVPTALAHLAPTRYVPGQSGAKNATTLAHPAAAAGAQSNKVARAGHLANVLKVFKRSGT